MTKVSPGAQFTVVFILMWIGLIWFFWRLYNFLSAYERPRPATDAEPAPELPPIDFGL
jgi:hypothetical protein